MKLSDKRKLLLREEEIASEIKGDSDKKKIFGLFYLNLYHFSLTEKLIFAEPFFI